jgi:hypothetical protein
VIDWDGRTRGERVNMAALGDGLGSLLLNDGYGIAIGPTEQIPYTYPNCNKCESVYIHGKL